MNVFVTKTCGELEITMSIEVDENSQHAQEAFVQMNHLLSDFIYDDIPAPNPDVESSEY